VDPASPSILKITVEFWRERADRNLTVEDARAAIENVDGFFAVLNRWAAETDNSKTES
jgi:hypothetical protein